MPRRVIASQYLYECQNSTGYFWSKIIEVFSRQAGGTVVIGPEHTGPGVVKCSGVEYRLFGSPKFDKSNLLERFWGQLKQSLSFCRSIAAGVKPGDVLVTGTTPEILLVFLPVICWVKGIKWVLIVHDIFPYTLVPAGLIGRRSFILKMLSWYFDRVYSRADYIVTIGRDMEAKMLEITCRADKSTICTIPNWVDENDVLPIPRSSANLLKDLKLSDHVVFQFFGNMGRVQGIGNLLSAISLVNHPRAAFIFVGSGTEADLVKEFSEKTIQHNVFYFECKSQDSKNDILAACDIALVTLEENMLGLAVPSKAYFSMAAARPLLAVMDESAEISLVIREHGIGWTCPAGDPVALARLIEEICDQPLDGLSERARNTFLLNYSERIAMEKFCRLIENIS